MAASCQGREVKYFTFKNNKCEFLQEIVEILKGKTVSEAYMMLIAHSGYLRCQERKA